MSTAHRAMTLAALLIVGCAYAAEEAPLPRASAPQPANESFRLGPEDVIDVFVWKEPELSTTAIVRPDGRVTLPLVGDIVAAGKTADELQGEIAEGLKQYVAMPTVTVMVKTINSAQISVLGEVKKPGRYRIAQQATVLDAIALGGGFTEFAHRNDIVVLRNTAFGVRRIHVDFRDLVAYGSKPLQLEPGDTVYVD